MVCRLASPCGRGLKSHQLDEAYCYFSAKVSMWIPPLATVTHSDVSSASDSFATLALYINLLTYLLTYFDLAVALTSQPSKLVQFMCHVNSVINLHHQGQ